MIAIAATLLVAAEAGLLTDCKVEKISSGYKFTEGPVWSMSGTLLFSDIPANRIYELKPEKHVFRDPSGGSNGLTLDLQGRLIACEHGNRRVSRTEKDGSVTVIAASYRGKKLNSPNDVVVKSDGSIYFTDPTYGIKPEQNELGFQGVYRVKPGSPPVLLVKDFVQPNGLCFSPDEKLLYIADSSDLRHIRVFDVNKDGRLANGRVFAAIPERGPGPDGMKVDKQGRLYAAGPNGVWVFDPSGRHIGTISVPETPANLAWGDADGKTLYITARTSIYKARLQTGGVLPGGKRK